MQVPLGYVVLSRLEPIEASSQENALALTASLRLDDERLRLAVIELLFERFEVPWQQISLRKEVEVLPEVLLHCNQVLSQ